MIRFLVILVGLSVSTLLNGQFCGTLQEPLLERVEANKKWIGGLQRGVMKYIPITFHLVAAASGAGRVTEEAVLSQLANLNVQYADQEAKFYIDRFNYFDNDAVYNTPASAAARIQMRLRKDNNSLNIFITNEADSGSGSPGVTLAYYDTQEDWIVSRKNQIGGSNNTIAHEIGHFFSLPHPFQGFECNPYTVEQYGNPVNRDFTLPCESGGGAMLIELQNGSNCNNAGDRICDTPPDYNLGLFFDQGCSQNNVVKDKNGEVIKPMVNNHMSYYDCTTYEFTTTQKNLINADFFTVQRLYIRTGVIPSMLTVEGPVNYLTPVNGEESNGATNILLDWDDVPGANKYLVAYSRNTQFTISPVKEIVTTSEFIITSTLIDGATYYWKVWPYNECMTDEGFSATQNFIVGTGVGVNEIREINSYGISPNPVFDHATAMLTLTSIQSFPTTMLVTDASGQILTKQNIMITTGISEHPVQTADLPVGIYFVILHSDKGRLVERLVILD